MGQVPALIETDSDGKTFCLAESHAILKYLAATRKVEDHWYPADVKKRALVDQYLDWHHSFLRQGASRSVFLKLFLPMLTGKVATEAELDFYRVYLRRSLVMMDGWLSQSKYLCGPQISIADLSAAHELD